MPTFPFPRSRLPARRRLVALFAVLLALLGYLGWLGGRALLARWERRKAEDAAAAYDFAEARRRLERCIRLAPRDPGLRLLAARTARRDGDLDEAERQLDAHRGLVGGPSADETLERALRLAQQGEIRGVLDYLMDALEIRHPQSEYILEALVMGCVQVYQLNRALFWTNELLERWPDNGIGRLFRAETLDTQNHRARAIALLEQLVADYPRFAKARLALASLLFKAQRYREAAEHYFALLEAGPGALAPTLGLATCYERLGSADEARPLLEGLLERHPDDAGVLLECARLALAGNDPARAEGLLRRAAGQAPNDSEVARELGLCLERLGRRDEARRWVDRSKEIEADLIRLEKAMEAMGKAPNDPAPRREAGRICLRNGQSAEGLRWLQGVLDVKPDDKETHRLLADYYRARGDEERAAFHARKAS